MLSPTKNDTTITWRCIASGDGLSENSIPDSCEYYDSDFYRAVKDKSIISKKDSFQVDTSPITKKWGWVHPGQSFLGKWQIEGGNMEVWNGLAFTSCIAATSELDGNRNQVTQLTHQVNTSGFSAMQLNFD